MNSYKSDSSRYYKLKIPNIDEIVKECREKILNSNIINKEESNLWYPDNSIFKELLILNKILKELGLAEHIYGIALNVTTPRNKIPIHIDTGTFKWSLNIPIHCFKDSYVAFYKTNEKPTKLYLPNNISYLGFKSENSMVPYKKISSEFPMLLNVKEPHNVINSGDKIRVMMLIRLKYSFNVQNYIQKNLTTIH